MEIAPKVDGGSTLVSFVFDDGFIASCLEIAQIYEKRSLKATFAVLVDHEGFMTDFAKGDFALWNELQGRGHIIHPHGFDHSDLTALALGEAMTKIDRCLDFFAENLNDFDAAKCTYHLAYNRSTPEIEAYLLSRVGAIRTCGIGGELSQGINSPRDIAQRRYSCCGCGPGHCDEHLLKMLEDADTKRPGLLMYMMHGLREEGWGPIYPRTLETALDRVMDSKTLSYCDLGMPLGVADSLRSQINDVAEG